LSLVENGNNSAYVYEHLADSYYKIENTIDAEKWYAETLKSSKDADTYYKYVQVLKYNEKYDEADKQMKLFVTLFPNDKRSLVFKNNPNYLTILKQRATFELSPLSVNLNILVSEQSFMEILYFATARKEGNKIYGWNNEPFLDLYQSTFDKQNNSYSVPTAMSELNSVYHEGPLTMAKDGNTIYFLAKVLMRSYLKR
jgi:tetratricopeptide (TPR) repeat protein